MEPRLVGEMTEQGIIHLPRALSFSGSYLGGHPARDRTEEAASLHIEFDGIRVKVFRTFINEPWENITALFAEGKGKNSTCLIVVEGTFGEFIFKLKRVSPKELRAKLATWTHLIGSTPEPPARRSTAKRLLAHRRR
jgi:hypothetical protein